MPIYEYQCVNCDHHFEMMQRLSDQPPEMCPECGKMSLRKKIAATAFQLKGSGWYATDFKDKPKPAPDTEKAASSVDSSDKTTKAAGKADAAKDKTGTSASSSAASSSSSKETTKKAASPKKAKDTPS